MFCEWEDLVLWELGIEQERQILRVSVPVQTHGLKCERIVFMFLRWFQGNQCTVWYLNGGRYLKRVVQTSQRGLRSSEGFEVRSALETLQLFYGFSFVEYLVWKKSKRALCNPAAQTGTLIGFINEMIVKAFSVLLCVALLPALFKVTAPYIISDRQMLQFTVTSLCVSSFAPNTRKKILDDVTGTLYGLDRVDSQEYYRTSGQYNAFCYIT